MIHSRVLIKSIYSASQVIKRPEKSRVQQVAAEPFQAHTESAAKERHLLGVRKHTCNRHTEKQLLCEAEKYNLFLGLSFYSL